LNRTTAFGVFTNSRFVKTGKKVSCLVELLRLFVWSPWSQWKWTVSSGRQVVRTVRMVS